MYVRHTITFLGASWLLPGLLVSLVAVPSSPARAQDPDGPKITPKAFVEVPAAQLRTPTQMAVAESAAPAEPVREPHVIPFMPTMSPAEYEAAKRAATSARAPELAKPGALRVPLAQPSNQGINFDGINSFGAGGSVPPDTEGAVSYTQFVETVNARVVVYNKLGPIPSMLKSTNLSAFFGTAEFIFDPRVVFDRAWQRWVIVATRSSVSSTDPVRRYYLAVSQTSDATGAYWIYSPGFGGGPFSNGDWWDFPQLGIDRDNVLITGNVFNGPPPHSAFKFAALIPIAKARVYNGLGFSSPVFTGLASTLAPPIVRDQNSVAYLIAAPNNGIALKKYTLSGGTLFGPVDIPVPAYSLPPNAHQAGTTDLLDSEDNRFVNASTQVGNNLWQAHTVALGKFPAPKFYRVNTATNTVIQSGFFFASFSSDDWNASIAANDSNDVFVTWSSTDSAVGINAQVRTSGKLNAATSISAGSALFTSPTFYNLGGTVERWGDYSAVSVDPGIPSRAWIVNEKINSSRVWGSRIGQIGF